MALFSEAEDADRLAAAYDLLEDFVYGGFMPVREDPDYRDRDAKMARIGPTDAQVFDFRSFDEAHGIRVFGRFYGKGKFIALTWAFREYVDWQTAADECVAEWRKLFGWLAPHPGRIIGDFFSADAEFV